MPLATAEDVELAVRSARAAFLGTAAASAFTARSDNAGQDSGAPLGWGALLGKERARYLRAMAQLVEDRKEELAVIEVGCI